MYMRAYKNTHTRHTHTSRIFVLFGQGAYSLQREPRIADQTPLNVCIAYGYLARASAPERAAGSGRQRARSEQVLGCWVKFPPFCGEGVFQENIRIYPHGYDAGIFVLFG